MTSEGYLWKKNQKEWNLTAIISRNVYIKAVNIKGVDFNYTKREFKLLEGWILITFWLAFIYLMRGM